MEISDVFSYFHGRKPPVYYGDLKPDNLMLGENGRLYLIDLGGAVNGYKYHHKVCTGTAGFAAPEQYEGKINAATDIYTFGKTLSALCGKTDCLLFIRNMSLFWLIFMLHEETGNALSKYEDCTEKTKQNPEETKSE